MKKIFGWFAVIAFVMVACDLEQAPESTATRAAVFGSEAGLEVYANSFYTPLTSPDFSIIPTGNAIIRSDEMADFAARTQVPDFIRENAYTPRQGSGWDWRALRNINFFIENCNNAAVTPEARRHYIALARFFRAWFYFDKVKRFGDVPWINKTMTITDTDLFNGRDSRLLVMDSVLADLNYAAVNIRTVTDNSRSLITRNVAQAFKSRVCLFEGTYRKYHSKSAETSAFWLKEAENAAQVVIKDGSFTLNEAGSAGTSYRQLFTSKAPVGNEIMLAAIANADLSVLNDANWWWTSATYGARVSFTRTFVNTYLNIDGTPFTNTPGYETLTFAQEVKGRDTRLKQSIRMGDYKRTNAGKIEAAPPVFSYTYTGYQPIKWTLDDTFYDGGTRNDNSISVIRYAEVLLNYAEAKAEQGTLTDEDWSKTIGALRKRAGITGGLTTKPTMADPYLVANYFSDISDATLLEIRRERAIELALEGFRFYDLIRWKKGDLLLKPWNGFYVPALNVPLDLNEDGINDVLFYKGTAPAAIAGVTFVNVSETISGGVNPQRLSNDTHGEITWLTNAKRVWTDRHYLYPIPEGDRLINPKIGQNPGWEGL